MGEIEPGTVKPTLSKSFFVNSEVVVGRKVLPGKKTAVFHFYEGFKIFGR
jgi:hypothetical protein